MAEVGSLTHGHKLSPFRQQQFQGGRSIQHGRSLQAGVAKHLVYCTIGADPGYTRQLKWLLLSIDLCTQQPNFEFLVICDAATHTAIQGQIPQQLKFKVDFMVLDPAVVDKPGQHPGVAASARKLDIYRYERIAEFTNVLSLDADHLFTFDVSEILAFDLQPGILYTHVEQRVMHSSQSHYNKFQQIEWGFQNYTAEQITMFREKKVHPFSASCLLFKNTAGMLEVFHSLKKDMIGFSGTNYFYEQSFLNYHFNTRLQSNTSLLDPYALEYWCIGNVAGKYTLYKKFIHFTMPDGDRADLVERYYHQEVVNQHHVRVAAMHGWLDTVTAFALESIPVDQRSSWFANMGHIGQVPREVQRYYRLAAKRHVDTICEIGFNAGHSAAVFLSANPYAKVYMFDLVGLPYSRRALTMFKAMYPDTFHFVQASSFEGVPWLQKAHPEVKCDLFSVDGDHSYEGALTDLINAVAVMPEGGILVADDVSDRFHGCKRAWQEMVGAGYIVNEKCEGPTPWDVNAAGTGEERWCWGNVAAPKKLLKAPHAYAGGMFQLDVLS